MNFYLDFEAKQYSEKIISIGCVAENGSKFYSLVKPKSKSKLSKFIIELTGITNEMLATAPDADVVFYQFLDFVVENIDDQDNNFFCYGDSDKRFLEKTIATMKVPSSINVATIIKNNLIDLSPYVGNFFGVKAVGLKKVLSYFKNESIEQNHIAIEDAIMLKEVVFHCRIGDKPIECPFENCIPVGYQSQKKEKKKIQTPPVPAKKQIKAVCNKTGKEYLFNSAKQALGLMKLAPTVDPVVICGRVGLAANNNKTYFGYAWSRVNNEELKKEV